MRLPDLRALVFLAVLGGTPALAQPDTTESAALTADSAAVADTVAVPDSIEVRTGQAGAQLDSAAVAALVDTTARVASALSEGADVDLFGRRLFEIWGGLGPFSPEDRAPPLGAARGPRREP